jgi:glycosyl transferase family 1
MFVCWPFEDQGCGLVIKGYTEVAPSLGHEVLVYGRGDPKIPLHYSLDIQSADAVVFVFEWTTALWQGDHLDLVRLMSQVPRDRRVILDGDGNYNDPIHVDGDYNHKSAEASCRWIDICDSLCDKICQPSLRPLRPNVIPFFFYAYNPSWEMPLDFSNKKYGMLYLGNSKFRWRGMYRVLQALEPIRQQVGAIALVGHGWEAPPAWATSMQMEEAYYADQAYLKKMCVEVKHAIPFEDVIHWMSMAIFNPILSRPTFSHLQIVTPRFFETPAANTIPIFLQDVSHVCGIYGEAAVELTLSEADATDKLVDIMTRPAYYAAIVEGMRQHLRREHSHAARLHQLIEIVES